MTMLLQQCSIVFSNFHKANVTATGKKVIIKKPLDVFQLHFAQGGKQCLRLEVADDLGFRSKGFQACKVSKGIGLPRSQCQVRCQVQSGQALPVLL